MIRVLSIIGIATPSFWLGVLLIFLLQIQLGWLPASGDLVPFTADPGEYMARMAMPCFAMALPLAGQMTRIIRTSMVEELDKDYVRTAIGAGVPRRVVIARNVFRNALITPVTVLGMKIGYLMGGAIVIEIILPFPEWARRCLTASIITSRSSYRVWCLSWHCHSSSSTSLLTCCMCLSTRESGRCNNAVW